MLLTNAEIRRGFRAPYVPKLIGGRLPNQEGGYTRKDASAVEFEFVTGQTSGVSSVQLADVAWNQAANVTLMPAKGLANGVPPDLRVYVTEVTAYVNGPTSWVGGGVNLEDTNGNVIATFPASCLQAYQSISFPVPALPFGQAVTASGGATTTVVAVNPSTFAATPTLSGICATCTSGTVTTAANVGLTKSITTNATGSFTVANAWPVAPVASDTFTVWGFQESGTAASGVSVNGTLVANAYVGAFATTINGAANVAGQQRYVQMNNAVGWINVNGLWVTNPDAYTLINISSQNSLFGAMAFGVSNQAPVTQLGCGLRLALFGVPTAGSSVRFRVRGYLSN